MKKTHFLTMLCFLLALPSAVLAAPSSVSGQNGNGAANSSQADSQTSATATPSSQSTNGQSQNETRTQNQANNPGVGTMSQEQLEARIQEQIEESKPEYTPKNEKNIEHKNIVANAAAELIRTASQITNTGIGDQIRLVAKTQNQNQDKIGQSLDKAEQRGAVAKFFIGSNYKQLKQVKQLMIENQNQVKQLEQIMAQLSSDEEKIAIANQIIVLQNTQLELKDQVEEQAGGFSLFGWINRWFNKY